MEIKSFSQILESKELKTIQRVLLTPVAQDYASVFADQFEATNYERVAQVTKDTELMIIPGHAFVKKFRKAFELRDDPEITQILEKGKISRNDWRVLLGIGGIGLVMGFASELTEGGSGTEVLEPSIHLYPNALLVGSIAIGDLGAAIAMASFLATLKVFTVPYAEYHEMAHSLSRKNIVKEHGARLSETWTDFWTKVVSEDGNNRRPSIIARLASDFANQPLTSFIGGWPIQSFDRSLMSSFVKTLEEGTNRHRQHVLGEMAQWYTGTNEDNLMNTLFELSKGHEQDTLNLFNQRGLQSKRISQMLLLLGAN